jgi:hypothetical protein
MAQTIKLKRSASAGSPPSTSDLELGEVAINTNDGLMFFKKNDGSDEIQEIVSGPQSSGNVAIRGTLTKEGKDVFSSSIVTSAPTSGSGFPTGHIFFVV